MRIRLLNHSDCPVPTGLLAIVPVICVISLFLLALLMGITGCIAEKRSLPFTFPDGFSQQGEESIPDRWWEVFNDTMLNTMMTDALSNNFDVLATWDRLDQAAAVAGIARSTQWPHLNVDVTTTNQRIIGDNNTGENGYGLTEGTSTVVTLAASYEIDLWGRIRAAKRAAAAEYHASQRDLSAAAMSLSSNVATTWYEYIESLLQQDLLARQKEVNERTLSLLEARFRAGLATASDVLQQQQQLRSVRSEIPLIVSRTRILKHQLWVLRGKMPTNEALGSVDRLPAVPPLPLTGMPADLVLRRPDVGAMHLRLRAADERVAEAAAARLPRLSISLSANDEDSNARSLFTNWIGALAGNLTAPLFSAGRLKRSEEQSRAHAQEMLHSFAGVTLLAIKDVEDALVREQQQRRFREELEGQVSCAERTLEATRQRYLNGDTDYLPVMAALQTLQRLERQRLEASRVLITYRISLYRALCGGWQLERPVTT